MNRSPQNIPPINCGVTNYEVINNKADNNEIDTIRTNDNLSNFDFYINKIL